MAVAAASRSRRKPALRFDYVPYPAPQPLETLWARPDLGCVFMCGYPVALQLAGVVPIAAPDTARRVGRRPAGLSLGPDRARGRALPHARGHLRWSCRLDRRALALGFQRVPPSPAAVPDGRRGRRSMARWFRNLVTARAILDAVRDGRIDVGPLDAYWHLLIAKHDPSPDGGHSRSSIPPRLRPFPRS